MQVVVESLETGFLVNIYSHKNCPGLLVSVLEAFDELGLNVMEARVSCADSFRLEAFGAEVRYMYLAYYIYTSWSQLLSKGKRGRRIHVFVTLIIHKFV